VRLTPNCDDGGVLVREHADWLLANVERLDGVGATVLEKAETAGVSIDHDGVVNGRGLRCGGRVAN
jgi:hypothetical protein